MRSCLIFNKNAGSAGAHADFVKQCECRSDCTLAPTRKPGDAERHAADAAREGCERIIVAGGDGTLNEVLNGLLANDIDAPPEVAVLPMGTGNDFARCLGIPLNDAASALDIALSGHVRVVDICTMTHQDGDDAGATRHFINMAYSDFGGIAGASDPAMKQRLGAVSYWARAVSRMLEHPEHTLSLEIDGRDWCIPAHGIIIANGRYVGGGVPVSADAILDDGLLDVTVVPVQNVSETLLAGLDIVRGQGDASERVIHTRARKVRVAAEPKLALSADGEYLGTCNALFQVHERRLRIVVGHAPEGFQQGDLE